MSVLVSYLHPEKVSHCFMDSLLRVISYEQNHDNNLKMRLPIVPSINTLDLARNIQAEQFLQTDCEWLWLVDSDMGFPENTLTALLEVADPTTHPVVSALNFSAHYFDYNSSGGATVAQRPAYFPTIEDGQFKIAELSDIPKSPKVIQVAGVGAACLLIHRDVMQQVFDNYKDWFGYLQNQNGIRIGEDLSFCYRVGELSTPIHVATGIRTIHHKQVWLGDMYEFANVNDH